MEDEDVECDIPGDSDAERDEIVSLRAPPLNYVFSRKLLAFLQSDFRFVILGP